MSDKEIQEFTEKVTRGLALAEKRMLKEKALRGQTVVISRDGRTIEHIPAQQIINEYKIFQD